MIFPQQTLIFAASFMHIIVASPDSTTKYPIMPGRVANLGADLVHVLEFRRMTDTCLHNRRVSRNAVPKSPWDLRVERTGSSNTNHRQPKVIDELYYDKHGFASLVFTPDHSYEFYLPAPKKLRGLYNGEQTVTLRGYPAGLFSGDRYQSTTNGAKPLLEVSCNSETDSITLKNLPTRVLHFIVCPDSGLASIDSSGVAFSPVFFATALELDAPPYAKDGFKLAIRKTVASMLATHPLSVDADLKDSIFGPQLISSVTGTNMQFIQGQFGKVGPLLRTYAGSADLERTLYEDGLSFQVHPHQLPFYDRSALSEIFPQTPYYTTVYAIPAKAYDTVILTMNKGEGHNFIKQYEITCPSKPLTKMTSNFDHTSGSMLLAKSMNPFRFRVVFCRGHQVSAASSGSGDVRLLIRIGYFNGQTQFIGTFMPTDYMMRDPSIADVRRTVSDSETLKRLVDANDALKSASSEDATPKRGVKVDVGTSVVDGSNEIVTPKYSPGSAKARIDADTPNFDPGLSRPLSSSSTQPDDPRLDSCPICLDELSGDIATVDKCKHRYHYACLTRFLKDSTHHDGPKCTLCRGELLQPKRDSIRKRLTYDVPDE